MTEATSGGFALVYSGNWYNTASYAVGAGHL